MELLSKLFYHEIWGSVPLDLLSIVLLVADQLGSSEMITNCQILYIYTTCNL